MMILFLCAVLLYLRLPEVQTITIAETRAVGMVQAKPIRILYKGENPFSPIGEYPARLKQRKAPPGMDSWPLDSLRSSKGSKGTRLASNPALR
jgi:hypothetical protein